ncbi:MAG: hypothetical protein WBG71_13775 [Leeuwenhoekiella sp.]
MKYSQSKYNLKIRNYGLVVFALILICTTSCTEKSGAGETLLEESDDTMAEEPDDTENKCPNGILFAENNGLVKVDIENPSQISNGWTTATRLLGFEGEDYLVWNGDDFFNNPGNGVMRFSIKITTPGVYQFVWSSRIAAGNSNTEHNDSWLKINADDFYGEKANTDERVYPKGSGKTPNPEGSSGNGYLKVYMNKLGEWFWRSSTNDNDPHNIFAKFNEAGTYDIEISGRSKSHAIDQFVLYRTDKTLDQAKASALSEIICK